MSKVNALTIKSVETWAEKVPLTRPYTIAFKTFDSVEMVFVRLTTANGLQAVGSGSPVPSITGEHPQQCRDALTGHAESLLKGTDIRQLNSLMRQLDKHLPETPAARSAIDIALYDLLAKVLDVPLAAYLGQVHHTLPTSITIGIKSIDEAMEEAAEYISAGFNTIKVKTGSAVEHDIELLHKLRESIDETIRIRVDANQGYTSADLIKFVDQTTPLNIEFIEQPLPADADDTMRELAEEYRMPCMADESLFGPAHAIELVHPPHPFGSFNIKLMKCGGIFPALQIANIAHLTGKSLMWGCMDESAISISAALHAAFACPATRYLDLDGSLDLASDPAKGGFILKDGMMSISDKPGLGIEFVE